MKPPAVSNSPSLTLASRVPYNLKYPHRRIFRPDISEAAL